MSENQFARQIAHLEGEFVYQPRGDKRIKPTEEQIVAIEQVLGYPLPKDYREFLRDFGGYAFFSGAVCEGIEIGYGLEVALGIMPGEPHDLMKNYYIFHPGPEIQHHRMPPELLPIGLDGGANPVCLALFGANRGKIYDWDHNEESYPPTWDGVCLIANSFTEFFHALKRSDEIYI